METSGRDFIPLKIAVLTISDTRTGEDDVSGKVLVERLKDAGHFLSEKKTLVLSPTAAVSASSQ